MARVCFSLAGNPAIFAKRPRAAVLHVLPRASAVAGGPALEFFALNFERQFLAETPPEALV